MQLESLMSVLRVEAAGSPTLVEAEEFGLGYAIRRCLEAGKAPKFFGVELSAYADYPNLIDIYGDRQTKTMIPVVGEVGLG